MLLLLTLAMWLALLSWTWRTLSPRSLLLLQHPVPQPCLQVLLLLPLRLLHQIQSLAHQPFLRVLLLLPPRLQLFLLLQQPHLPLL